MQQPKIPPLPSLVYEPKGANTNTNTGSRASNNNDHRHVLRDALHALLPSHHGTRHSPQHPEHPDPHHKPHHSPPQSKPQQQQQAHGTEASSGASSGAGARPWKDWAGQSDGPFDDDDDITLGSLSSSLDEMEAPHPQQHPLSPGRGSPGPPRQLSPNLLHVAETMLRLQASLSLEDLAAAPRSAVAVADLFEFHGEIGRGHYGVVRTCTEKKNGRTFACKTIQKTSIQTAADLNELCSEVLNMVHLRLHTLCPPQTVQLHDVFHEEASLHLILDHCPGGDLFDHVARQRRLGEREAAQVLCQLAQAVMGLHRCGLVHRDLKPENILLWEPPEERGGSWKLKIADFGLCLQMGPGQRAKGVAGSPFYMAPEVITGQYYSTEVDVWSLGVITYTCLSGTLPFFGKGHEAVFSAVCKAPLDFSRKPWPNVSYEAKSLICLMLDRNPNRRIKMEDVLQHPWLLKHCPELHERSTESTGVHGRLSRALQGLYRSNKEAAPTGTSAAAADRGAADGMQRSSSHSASSHAMAEGAEILDPPGMQTHAHKESGGMDCGAADSTTSSQFSFAASSGAASAAFSAANEGSGVASTADVAESQHKVEMAKHRVPAGSKKGFSAPLTRQEKASH